MIAAQLRRQIVTGQLEEGQALPSETELMAQYGVSRPTLREAFRILESEQVIQVRRGARGGARVTLPDASVAARYVGTLLQYRRTTLADVHEARANLEATAVAVLARKRTAADLRVLDQMLAEGAELLADPMAFGTQYDLEFHRLLMQLAGNQTLTVLLDIVATVIESHVDKFVREHRADESARASSVAAHRAHVKLVQLIRDKDADKAVAFWRKHLAQVKDFLIADLEAESVLDIMP
ncbi:FadR/GntR family transcriptional regulator [Nocardia nova]|nr:GntR family transcriptional regulator [Nocardia nova]